MNLPKTSLTAPILYLVTGEIGDNVQKWKEIVEKAVCGGVTMVQLRDKKCSHQTMIKAAKIILPFLKARGVPLLINDRVDIACIVKADGVHLGQSDAKVTDARALLGNDALIGLSVESFDQARTAMYESINYIAASPVFHTSTKSDCHTPWNLEGLRELCVLSKFPVFGIGGINAFNAFEVLKTGAIGVAVVSSIFNASCPETAAREIRDQMRKYEH